MHADDVIQSEKIMSNPAQDSLLKIFAAISSLLRLLRDEWRRENTSPQVRTYCLDTCSVLDS